MADFCQQCSKRLFDEDFKELAGITTEEQTANGIYATAICEGCGATLVDHLGRCILKDCLEKHGTE